MTKYAHMTNDELLRLWSTLDYMYLLSELVSRLEHAVDTYPELKDYRVIQRWDGTII